MACCIRPRPLQSTERSAPPCPRSRRICFINAVRSTGSRTCDIKSACTRSLAMSIKLKHSTPKVRSNPELLTDLPSRHRTRQLFRAPRRIFTPVHDLISITSNPAKPVKSYSQPRAVLESSHTHDGPHIAPGPTRDILRYPPFSDNTMLIQPRHRARRVLIQILVPALLGGHRFQSGLFCLELAQRPLRDRGKEGMKPRLYLVQRLSIRWLGGVGSFDDVLVEAGF